MTDNTLNFKATGKILHNKMPHIFWVSCAAYCIDLMLEDIGKSEDVQTIIDEEKMITGLIYSHQFMTDLLRELNQVCELLRPGITRFVMHFVAFASLCRAKANIMQIWTS